MTNVRECIMISTWEVKMEESFRKENRLKKECYRMIMIS